MVVVVWADGKGAEAWLNGTDQIVIYCGPIGHGNSSARAKKKQRDNSGQFAMVEIVDPETMLPMRCGIGRRFNAYVVGNLEVTDLVRRSQYARLTAGQQRMIETQDEVDDPVLRGSVELAKAAGRGEL